MPDFVYCNLYWWIGYSSVKIEYCNSSIYYTTSTSRIYMFYPLSSGLNVWIEAVLAEDQTTESGRWPTYEFNSHWQRHCGRRWEIHLSGQPTRTWWLLSVWYDEAHWTCLCSHGFPATALQVFRPKLSDQNASLPGTSYVSITIQCRDMDSDLGGSAETGVVPHEMSATAA